MSKVLSDYNPRPNYRSNVTSRKVLYGDIDLRLLINSNTGDIQKYTDVDAIKNSLKNLILSNYYERPFKPFVAGNVTGLLFEPQNRFTALRMKESIIDLIVTKERRVQLVSVLVSGDPDNNEFNVSINFQIGNIEEEVDIVLKQYR